MKDLGRCLPLYRRSRREYASPSALALTLFCYIALQQGGGGGDGGGDARHEAAVASAAEDLTTLLGLPSTTVALLCELTSASERQCATALALAKGNVDYALRLLGEKQAMTK